MKETRKKRKKGLLIGIIIGAVALVGLGVGGFLLFGQKGGSGNKPESAGIETDATDATEPEVVTSSDDIFWNADRSMYAGMTEIGTSSRTPDKLDGYYHIRFAVNGRIVERRVADKKVVNLIDALDVMGLITDEKGIVVGVRRIEEFTGGILHRGFYVSKVEEDGTIILNSAAGLNGMDFDLVLGTAKLYDVSGQVTEIGAEMRPADLVQYDRIYTVQDQDGNVIVGFITNRYVRTKIYWNIERCWDASIASTTRLPDLDGVYTFEMACEGEIVTVKTKSRAVANEIDKQAAKVVSLKFDKEGYATEYVSAYAGGSFGSWYHITELSGTKIVAHKFIQATDTGNTMEGVLAANYEVYDVSGLGDFIGQKYENLKVYDQIHAVKNSKGEVSVIFVVGRLFEGEIYWNMEREYDSVNKCTKKTPDADGYYWFDLAVNGSVKKFKTNDQKVANEMDAAAARVYSLKLEGENTVTGVVAAKNVSGGGAIASWFTVMSVQDAKHYTTKKILQAADTGTVTELELTDDCKIYNVSTSFTSHEGELVNSLRIGDIVHCLTNLEGQVNYVMLIRRTMNGEIYWNLSRKYNSTTKQTTRVPDAEGYYVFQMATGGRQVTLRTKDKKIANEVDSYIANCMCLEVSGDIIVKTGATSQKFKTSGGTAASWYDVLTMKGNEFYAKKIIQASDTGKDVTLKIAKDVEVYNVGAEYTIKGEKTDLRVGDRVHVLLNADKEASVVFIVNRPGVEKQAACPECGKTVTWVSFNGSFVDSDKVSEESTGRHILHYFLNGDRSLSGQVQTIENTVVHLDMNGHTLTGGADARTITLFSEKTDMLIMDTSEGKTGVIKSQNGKGRGGDTGAEEMGGVIWIRFGSDKLTIRDVTIDCSDMDQNMTNGALYVPAGATLTLENVKVKAAKNAKRGAAIYSGGNVILKDTVVTGGTNVLGGSVFINGGTGTISGKTAISGGVLTDGTGANLYLNSGIKIKTTADGITSPAESIFVTPLASGAFTDNDFAAYKEIFKADASGEITLNANNALEIAYELTGIAIDQETIEMQAGGLQKLVVKPVPAQAALGTLTFESSDPTKVTVDDKGNLKAVAVTGAEGVTITVKTADEKSTTVKIVVTEPSADAHLHVAGTLADINAQTGEKILFEPFDRAKLLSAVGGSAYMYLEEDVELSATLVIPNTTLVLCLNGHKLTRPNGRVIQNNDTTQACEIKICDCSAGQTGEITGGSADQGGTLWVTTSLSPLTIYGGTYTSTNPCTHNQGGAVILASVFNMYGGTVKDGVLDYGTRTSTAAFSAGGANVVANTFNMYGGTIEGGTLNVLAATSDVSGKATAVYGFGGNVYATTFNMYGGTIRNGKILLADGIDKSHWNSGGNVYARNLTMTGGVIEDGSAGYGGNVHISGNSSITGGTIKNGSANAGYGGNVAFDNTSSTLTVGGTALIEGGTAENGGGGNVRVNGIFVLEGDAVIKDGTAKTNGGNIWVQKGSATLNGGTVSGGSASSGGNVRTEQALTMNGGIIEESKAGQNVFVNIMNGGVPAVFTMNGGTIRNSVNGTANVVINGGANGSNVAYNNAVFYMNGGEIYKDASHTGRNVDLGGAMYMTAGKIYGGKSTNSTAGNIQLFNSANRVTAPSGVDAAAVEKYRSYLSVTGGEIYGGESSNGGGNIYLAANSTTVISGGEIYGGTHTGGDNSVPNMQVDANANLTVTGGTILCEEEPGEGKNRNALWINKTANVSITGGEFTRVWAQGGITPFISGGSFYQKPGTSHLVAGYVANELDPAQTKTVGGTAYNFRYGVEAGSMIVVITLPETDSAEVGSDKELTATVNPGAVTITTVEWTSSDTGVATVVKDGTDPYKAVVTAIGTGTATITLKINEEFTGQTAFTVTAPPVVHQDHCICGTGLVTSGDHTAHETVTSWKEWTSTTRLPDVGDLSAGDNYFYLSDSVTLSAGWTPSKASQGGTISADMSAYRIILCLNGHTVTKTGNSRLMTGYPGSSTWTTNIQIVVTDCQDSGKITLTSSATSVDQGGLFWLCGSGDSLTLYNGTLDASPATSGYNGNGGFIDIHSGGYFKMYGGTVKGGKHSKSNGGTIRGGSIYIYGGTVEGGRAEAGAGGNIFATAALTILGDAVIKDGYAKGNGGNIYFNGTTFKLQGGLITGGSAADAGGNIALQGGTTEITGGTVEDGASGGNKDVPKANVFIHGNGATVKIAGGVIKGRMLVMGVKSLEFGGTPVIHDGSYGISIENTNTAVTAQDIKIGTTIDGTEYAHFADGADIYIYSFVRGGNANLVVADSTVIATGANAADAGYVTAANYLISARDDNGDSVPDTLHVASEHKHKIYGVSEAAAASDEYKDAEDVVFEEIDLNKITATAASETHYYMYLPADLSTPAIVVGDNIHLHLCLNGHKLQTTTSRAIQMSGTKTVGSLTICDCGSTGEIVGKSADQGGTLWSNSKAKLTLFGGTITNSIAGTHRLGGTVICAYNFDMYGGTVKDGVLHYGSRGTVEGSKYTLGGANVRTEGVFNMYGGTIEGGRLIIDRSASPIVDSSNKPVYESDGETQKTQAVWGFGGNVYAEKFNLYDGLIKDGRIEFADGVSVWVSGANVWSKNFQMKGGTIENGFSDGNGGNLHLSGGTSKIEDGTITGGTANGGYGGNIAIDGGSVTILNSTVTGGKSKGIGGNVRVGANGTLTIGASGVSDSTEISGGVAGRYVTLDAEHEPTDTVKTFGSSGGNVALEYSNNNKGTLTMYAGTLKQGTAVGGNNEGESTTNNGGWGGNVYMGDKCVFTLYGGTLEGGVADDNSLSACGRGGNVFVGTNAIFTMNGGIVKDGEAKKTNNSSDSSFGGNVFINNSATAGTGFFMNGGIVSGGNAVSGGNVRVHNYGRMEMTGGIIENTVSGNNIFVNIQATLVMSNGIIRNAGNNAANIVVNGTGTLKAVFNMTGGTLLQNTGTGNNLDVYGTFTMSQDAVIAGNKVNFGTNAANCSISGGFIPALGGVTKKIVTGGTFATAPGTGFLADGYQVKTLSTAVTKIVDGTEYTYGVEVTAAD